MTMDLGPVSRALESDLREWVRKHGIVVWLDLDHHYSGFVDRLARRSERGELPYAVRAYRGSHLALMLALDGLAAGTEKTPLVVHLPGFNEESVRATPALEVYAAGVRYRKALDTLVAEAAAGRVRPEQIAAYRESGRLTLEGADAWLSSLLEGEEGELAAALRALPLTALLDRLLAPAVADRADEPLEQSALAEGLQARLAMPAAWRDAYAAATGPGAGPRGEDRLVTAAGWALCVEYVDDLKRPPVDLRLQEASRVQRVLVDACREAASHLRARHPSFYKGVAEETQGWLAEEVDAARAEDLGRTDTFRFEEDTILKAALAALGERRWQVVLEWAEARVDGDSFWLRNDPARLSAWQLVGDGARLGLAIDGAGPALAAHNGLDQAVERYREVGVAVDQAHRHLEQRRLALLYPQLPDFETLRERLDALRARWRTWADAWGREFNAICRAEGFLPSAALQQRTLFEEVVRPLTQEPGTTALFLIDALRFEMGEELYRQLVGTPATTVHLAARLAELPTVTEVGMNVLAPVAERGRLRPVLAGEAVRGFALGEFTVSDPESRKRAIHGRIGGATCPWLTLDEVLGRDAASLKQAVARARLVVVHSLEIDDAGEKGAGLAVFDLALQRLRAAWRLLRDAGVRRFVITADHGFLLLDPTAGSAQSHGRRVDPKRRHVFSPLAADHRGEARVALADLGYEGASGYLMFPETTAVFDTGQRLPSFVHGGNSLQERVIPVLTLIHRAAAGVSNVRYAVSASAREGVAGMHCIAARVDVAAQDSLDFGGSREVELALRVTEAAEVQVELCQTRGGAALQGGVVRAAVGQPFELFFRLLGSADRRVLVELGHAAAEADVTPCVIEERFAVTGTRPAPVQPAPATVGGDAGTAWLDQLPTDEVRAVFRHLASHGAVTEGEAAEMLGGQRALRRFALRVEEYATRAPFAVRIDVVAGVKRYVREGTAR